MIMRKLSQIIIFILLIQLYKTQDSSNTSTTESTPKNTANQKEDLIFQNQTKYCSCDLTGNLCDLNCCCDSDCSNEDKRLFSRCLDASTKYRLLDSKYCYNQKIIYKNNTNYILERLTDFSGLFCIYTDNTKQQSYLIDRKIIKKIDDFNSFNLKAEYNWTDSKLNFDLTSDDLIETSQLENYRAEKAIYLLNSKRVDQLNKQFISLTKFQLPFSLIIQNGECNSLKNVNYLSEFNSYCFKLIRNLQSECKANTRYDVNSYNLVLICNSKSIESTGLFIENVTSFCTQQNCVQTQSRNQVKSISYQNQMCINMVNSVNYEIIYNENGIKKVQVNFEYENVKEAQLIKQFQKFNVKFLHENLFNQSMNISHYSGNLGYNLEKPLIGRFRNLTNNQTVALPFKFVDLQRDDDLCDSTNVSEQNVQFGLNHRSGCFFYLNLNLSNDNFCEDLNDKIVQNFEQKTNQNLLFTGKISSYGKYNLSSDHWVQLIKQEKSSKSSTENLNTNQNELKINCRLLRQVNYLFVYSMVADLREPQRKLIAAIQTQTYNSFNICLNSVFCKIQSIELSTSVQFVQINSEKRTRYADSPAFKLELPEDFFYPFVSN